MNDGWGTMGNGLCCLLVKGKAMKKEMRMVVERVCCMCMVFGH